MATARYNTSGPWWKGNTHIHTTKSDGGRDYAAVAALYAKAGYDFIFITDHGRVADIEAMKNPPLLALNGTETDGRDRKGAYYHVVGLGTGAGLRPGFTYEGKDFLRVLRMLKRAGAVTILAHPHWTGNSVEEALSLKVDAVEVYNHVCNWLNGKYSGAYHWDCMLERQGDVLGFAADDAHIKPAHPGWNGGWIMVSAPRLTKRDILAAIHAGRFYSSTGPEIRSIRTRRGRLEVRCSPVKEIRLAGRRSSGRRIGAEKGKSLTRAVFELGRAAGYWRLELQDDRGGHAWTNTVFYKRGKGGAS